MVKTCIVGCLHGELGKMYKDIENLERRQNIKVELILCCGDFQALRNLDDLTVMCSPEHHKRMGDFWQYYAGLKEAPILTIFVGGNHEASNFLLELPYGGWVAPNIYYMGLANVLWYRGLRIAGMSGIYKEHDISLGHFERPPFTENTKRSAYHQRNIEAFRLSLIQQPVDIVLSHDWPRGVHRYGNTEQLLKTKPFFLRDIRQNVLGSPALETVLCEIQPRYWFAAHLHVKFPAMIKHTNLQNKVRTTRFLALHKAIPNAGYLQMLDIVTSGDQDSAVDQELSLDPEWLCILQKTDSLFRLTETPCTIPHLSNSASHIATPDDLQSIAKLFDDSYEIPLNFEVTAPIHKTDDNTKAHGPEQRIYVNPQTDLLSVMLELKHPNAIFAGYKSSLLDQDVNSQATNQEVGDGLNEDDDD